MSETYTIDNENVVLYPLFKQAVVDALEEYEYGDIIPKDWLLEHFDIHFPATATPEEFRKLSFKFVTAFDGFRDDLLVHHQIMLKNVYGRGYYLVPPTHQTQTAMEDYIRAYRKANNIACRSLDNIRTDMLSHQQKQANLEARAKVAAISAYTRKSVHLGKPSSWDSKKLPKDDDDS